MKMPVMIDSKDAVAMTTVSVVTSKTDVMSLNSMNSEEIVNFHSYRVKEISMRHAILVAIVTIV